MRTIIFDLDGVVWERDFHLLGHLVCLRLEVPSAFQNFFADKIAQAIYTIPSIHTRVTKALVLEKLSAVPMLDVKSVFDQITDAGLLYSKTNNHALPVIRALHKKGYRLTCRTNWFRSVQEAELGRTGLLPYFDNIIGMLGEYFKPHPASLDSIIAGKSYSQFIIIGDSPEKEVMLANTIGIQSIWLNETGRATPKDKILQPTFQISRIEQLLDIL